MIMKKKGIVFVFLFLFVFLVATPLKSEARWKFQNGKYYYYNSKGVLYKNRKVGKYYAGKTGARLINRWKGRNFYGEDGRRIPGFSGGWYTIKGKRYYYTPQGKKLKGFNRLHGKRYYFDLNGVLQVGFRQIDGNYYYFLKRKSSYGAMLKGWQKISKKTFYFGKSTGKLQTGWFKLSGKKYYATRQTGIYTGIRDVGGQSYIFSSKGILQNGWKTYKGNKYYCTYASGAISKGLCTISGKLYYFNAQGAMQKNTNITINGVAYSVDGKGRCTVISNSNNMGTEYDFIFFTTYECGYRPEDITGYSQVGGDSGNAYGKYQFDRRYSLIPLIKYCYNSDPVAFKAFDPFKNYQNTAKYYNRFVNSASVKKKFTAAWTSIYNTSPYLFKKYQDNFAKDNYYTPTERQLQAWGIDISGRPNIVKGVVYSYSIQHGAYSAALAVRNAKITNATNNEDFIKNLYSYRWKNGWKKNSAYKSRYTNELADALGRLR